MAEMDIERFVEAPGRDEKIKQVRTMTVSYTHLTLPTNREV